MTQSGEAGGRQLLDSAERYGLYLAMAMGEHAATTVNTADNIGKEDCLGFLRTTWLFIYNNTEARSLVSLTSDNDDLPCVHIRSQDLFPCVILFSNGYTQHRSRKVHLAAWAEQMHKVWRWQRGTRESINGILPIAKPWKATYATYFFQVPHSQDV